MKKALLLRSLLDMLLDDPEVDEGFVEAFGPREMGFKEFCKTLFEREPWFDIELMGHDEAEAEDQYNKLVGNINSGFAMSRFGLEFFDRLTDKYMGDGSFGGY